MAETPAVLRSPAEGAARRARVVLIGPLAKAGVLHGGAEVSFRNLVRDLRQRKALECTVIDTERPHWGRSGAGQLAVNAQALLRAARQCARAAATADVILLSCSDRGLYTLAPVVAAIARRHRVALVIRVFGGGLDLSFRRLGPLRAVVLRRTLGRADRVLFQTRALCRHFAGMARVEWLPTVRDLRPAHRRPPGRRLCVVYAGRLTPEKGLPELLAAARQLEDCADFRVHGPCMPAYALPEPLPANVTDGGRLAPDAVAGALGEADVFVLPSRHAREGYPGAVIEALQCGLPVVATRWRAIPEIITHGENGLLVPPGDADALARAIRRLHDHPDLRQRLATQALRSGERYRAGPVHDRLVDLLTRLCAPDERHPG